MRTLIVGSSSVIGRALGREMASMGPVTTAGRRDADVFVDLCDWAAVPKLESGVDAVVHAAADFGGGLGEDLVRAEAVNALGALVSCRLARHAGAHEVVLLSSIFAALSPGDPYFGAYSLSKRHAEEVASAFCGAHGIRFTALRLAQVYDAAGDCRRHQPFLYTIADRAERGEDVVVFGRHDAVRNFIHLDDVVQVVRRVVEAGPGGTFECANPRSSRVSDIAALAFATFGRGGKVVFDDTRPDLADVRVTGDASLYRAIRYEPRVDLAEGMRRIRAHREHMRAAGDGAHGAPEVPAP